jgi:hypothetical protein
VANNERIDRLLTFVNMNLLPSFERISKMGLFSKASKYHPVALSDGSSMSVSLSTGLPQQFIFEELVSFDEKPLEWQVFDWHPDFVTNMSQQMHVKDYMDIASGISLTYYEIAPMKISNKRLRLVNTDGIGILSEEALCFFWESRTRFNILVFYHMGTRKLLATDHFEFVSVNEGVVCRRSPAAEMIENEQWAFTPSLTNYGKRNKDSLSMFFTLQLLQDKYMNEGV